MIMRLLLPDRDHNLHHVYLHPTIDGALSHLPLPLPSSLVKIVHLPNFNTALISFNIIAPWQLQVEETAPHPAIQTGSPPGQAGHLTDSWHKEAQLHAPSSA